MFQMRKTDGRWLGLVLVAGLTGCGNPLQSALHPASPDAAAIAFLCWLMTAAFTAVFVLVLVLLAISLLRKPSATDSPPLGRNGFIFSGGVLLPLITVIPLYLLSLQTSATLRPNTAELTIRVVGHQWWWEVHYPESGIVIANELYIPAGKPIRLELASADVIHSLWVPSLNGKRDLIPGLENEFWLRADQPGVYRGFCAEYCGTQHANMRFVVIALSPQEFDEWVAARQQPPTAPRNEQHQRGLDVFLRAGCARCHSIRGTPANGQLGPDLTHISSRSTLGAGLLPNTRGNLAGWIGDAPSLKPGVLMPKTYLESSDLFDLIAYLESLE